LAKNLAKEGVIYSNFYNYGSTYTNPGHTAITTGNYQKLNNSGKELPQNPSVFQHWLKSTGNDSSKAFIITSKDKLEVLANCKDSVWTGTFMPSTNCGVGGAGLGSGYRKDSLTFENVKSVLANEKPNLLLINFKEPDGAGHRKNWSAYLDGIRNADEYVFQLWNIIQSNSAYADKTTLFVTNDHGRHLDGHKDSFVSHGDSCSGCQHINLFAIGPDFKKGLVIDINREQIDISATTAKLLGFDFPTGKGKVMDELFMD
jgi:arylsulfatase A-like enzyme